MMKKYKLTSALVLTLGMSAASPAVARSEGNQYGGIARCAKSFPNASAHTPWYQLVPCWVLG
jgi:hypothetical protein